MTSIFKTPYVTSAAPSNSSALSIDMLEKALKDAGLLPKPDCWIVVDPYGQAYKGKLEDLMLKFLPELLREKRPLTFEVAPEKDEQNGAVQGDEHAV